jgi:hypothetical protein
VLVTTAIRPILMFVCAASCERACSAFGYVHTASRNRMAADRATDMTMVYWNLRLRDQLAEASEHQYFAWDEMLDEDSAH